MTLILFTFHDEKIAVAHLILCSKIFKNWLNKKTHLLLSCMKV